MDEFNLKEWLSVGVGDIIIFKDNSSLMEDMHGLGMTVDEVHTFRSDHINYIIFEFDARPDRLIIKYNNKDFFESRHYYPIEWMGEGSREDFLRNKFEFLFNPPETEQFLLKDLTWADQFSLICNEEDIVFRKVAGSEVYGEISDTKEPEVYFCGIVEFKADKPVDDPLVLIMETGGEDSDIGGWVAPFEGHLIRPIELEVLKKH